MIGKIALGGRYEEGGTLTQRTQKRKTGKGKSVPLQDIIPKFEANAKGGMVDGPGIIL